MFCHSTSFLSKAGTNLMAARWLQALNIQHRIWIGVEKIHFSANLVLFKDFFDHCTKETDYWHIKSDIYDFLIQIYAKQNLETYWVFTHFQKLFWISNFNVGYCFFKLFENLWASAIFKEFKYLWTYFSLCTSIEMNLYVGRL